MFSFLQEYLKYIQISIFIIGIIYLYLNKELIITYIYPITLLFAGGLSNILDRFIHGAVVDYIYWHCGFDFAIFNLADILIDLAIALIFYINYKKSKQNT